MSREEIEKKIEEAENRLDNLIKSNTDAWNIYGSELCAGDMIGKEDKIRAEIRELNNELSKSS